MGIASAATPASWKILSLTSTLKGTMPLPLYSTTLHSSLLSLGGVCSERAVLRAKLASWVELARPFCRCH